MLSGDNWLTAQVDPTPAGGLLATWRVSVPESGRYDLWARVGDRAWTGNDWRFDDQPWRTSGKEDAFHQVRAAAACHAEGRFLQARSISAFRGSAHRTNGQFLRRPAGRASG
ncbi:MAG: hypothetical protein KAX19_08995 [Candidatus Brocadiae bacterium]|nr:hypothetical protein [Candidatus Brocadiia bacterium]